MHHARARLLFVLVPALATAAACSDPSTSGPASLTSAAGQATGIPTRAIATPGNCGGSHDVGEDTCEGREDGLYCSTLRDFSAFECKNGSIAGGQQCPTGQRCAGPNAAGTTIECEPDDDTTDDGAPKQTVSPKTDPLTEYAGECEGDVGLMPAFDCLDFPEIPTLQDGKPLTVTGSGASLSIERDGVKVAGKLTDIAPGSPLKVWSPPPRCDNPSWASTPCYPGTRVGLIESGGASWAILCRRQSVQRSDDPYFQLIGVIAHNKSTGATCFFDKKPEVTLPKKADFPQPGATDKKVQQAAVRAWAAPGPGFENCLQCHAAGAFIRSPYVASVKLSRAMGNEYKLVGRVFKELWTKDKKDGAAEDRPRDLEITDGSCQGCHRLATSTQSRMFANLAVGGPDIDDKSSATRLANVKGTNTRWPLGYWMPPDGRREKSLADWESGYGPEKKSLVACLADPSGKGCAVTDYAYFK